MTDTAATGVGLYIHIPWCIRKCPYCDFNSHQQDHTMPEAAYVAHLLQDLDQEVAGLGERPITSIFFGGGTPSLFSAASIATIVHGVGERTWLQDSAEITLEANPGAAEAERFAGYVEAGVNRLSIGVQSLQSSSLEALGRVHNADDALATIELARQLPLRSFNIDLMHGLPGQSSDDASADLRAALQLEPPHLSWYQLTIEPNTAFHSAPPTLPDEDALALINDNGEQHLLAAGLEQYEVSAWSEQQHQCQHNLNYWNFGDYVGIGAGAHSKLRDPVSGQTQRWAKTRSPADYLKRDAAELRVQQRGLDHADLIGEYMLNALRLRAGFTQQQFVSATGLAWEAVTARVAELEHRGLLENDGTVRASALGWRYLDSVIAEFFID